MALRHGVRAGKRADDVRDHKAGRGLLDPEVAVLEEGAQPPLERSIGGVAHRELERVLHRVSPFQ